MLRIAVAKERASVVSVELGTNIYFPQSIQFGRIIIKCNLLKEAKIAFRFDQAAIEHLVVQHQAKSVV